MRNINGNKTIERCNIRRVNERSNGQWDLASMELIIFKERAIPAFIASLEPIFVLIYSCPGCMLRLGFTTQDPAGLHQLSACVILYGKLDNLGSSEGCSSEMAVELPAQYKGGG